MYSYEDRVRGGRAVPETRETHQGDNPPVGLCSRPLVLVFWELSSLHGVMVMGATSVSIIAFPRRCVTWHCTP